MILSKSILTKFKNLDLTQKIAIAIPVLFILSCLIKYYVQRFRFSDEFRWIYEYGSIGTLFLCFFLTIFSFTNSVLILRDLKARPIEKFLWFLLSSSVFILIARLLIAIELDIA